MPADFITRLFAGPAAFAPVTSSPWRRTDYLDLICTGGYPEVVTGQAGAARQFWFDGYLRAVVQRDIESFANIQRGEVVPRLLTLVAARAGSTLSPSDLAQAVELNQRTVRSYLTYLDTVFLLGQVPAWGTNLSTKAARTPKAYITDPGLAAYLLEVDAEALGELGHPALGGLVETFVFTELTRLLSMADVAAGIRYFRDRNGREIDFILERRNGQVVGLEVKASSTVTNADFRHLRWLKEQLGDRFVAGYVLHLGPETGSFGDGLAVLPLSAMWHDRPLPG